MSNGKFLRVICPKCKKSQIIFGKASIGVKCENCNASLVKTTGGKTKVKAEIKEILWN